MELQLSEKYKINIIKDIEYNKEQLIKEIKFNVDVSKRTFEKGTEKEPGIQSDILIQTESLSKLKNIIWEKFCEIYGYAFNTAYHLKYWCYISDEKNKYSGYHIHTLNDELYLENQYTWVFYIQLPTNLGEGEDSGRILFRTDDTQTEHKIKPLEGSLIFFPADLPHRPEINLGSDKERIVLAGNYCILDLDKGYKKKTKTIL